MDPIFKVFETLVAEAYTRGGEWRFEVDDLDEMAELKHFLKSSNYFEALKDFKMLIDQHFDQRAIKKIINLDLRHPKVRILSKDRAKYIVNLKRIRGNPAASKEFENIVTDRLSRKLPGLLHCVGDPRLNRRTKDFKNHLTNLGFNTLRMPRIKDGGLDVIWLMPFGEHGKMPIINFQCKNTEKIGNEIKVSVTDAIKTFTQHNWYKQKGQYMIFVVLNTYLSEKITSSVDGYQWIYLGVTDLLDAKTPKTEPLFL